MGLVSLGKAALPHNTGQCHHYAHHASHYVATGKRLQYICFKLCCAETDTEAEAESKKYSTFWKEFGKTIKLGIIEDTQNRARLAKLLRFQTSKSGTKEIGLDAYIEGMKEGQKSIYYLAGMALLCARDFAMSRDQHQE